MASHRATASQTATIGGGCPQSASIAVGGPLTLGSTLRVDYLGCPFTPSGAIALMIGVPLTPQPAQLPIMLQTSIVGAELCHIAVIPTIGVANFQHAQRAIAFQVPNDPIFTTFDVGMQSICIVCGIAGCYFDVSQAVSIRFQ